ncbi:E3 ubiquitin-protein ligase rnf8-B-like [Leptopilina heterotoma]|uniref:E3 ubiquitin-protein ligase rnf8-B-like n=1 Tax=Leptopilina heterotoma TaxID=63436 RepID=UPI001CAA3EC9|nr:E3 ubiquitin-protein ligase rnf8-B-like [Leptopilina heterotoma]
MKSSLESLEKVMVEANHLVAHMVQISQNNLETERLRLKNLELEAEKKSEKKEEVRAQRSRTFQNENKETRCHRCNAIGHWAKDCHLQNCGQWFCYYCQKVTDHKGDDCPTTRRQPYDKNRDKRGH